MMRDKVSRANWWRINLYFSKTFAHSCYHIPSFHFKFLLNLLGWHHLIKLYMFQVNSSSYVCCIVFTTQSQVSCTTYHNFTHFYHPEPLFTSGKHQTVVCVNEVFWCCCCLFVLAESLHIFLLTPIPLTSDSCQSVSVSMSRLLFCLVVYFVH